MGSGPSKAPEGFDQMTFDKSKQFNVNIQYCGGWGYGSYANYAKQLITAAYPGCTVAFARDNGTTGNMEITHVPSG